MAENKDHLISNRTYDLLKRIVTLLLPGIATLYAAIGAAWDFPNTEAVVATLAAVATFGGVLMSFSTKSWNESNSKYDGELITAGYDEITGLPDLQLKITNDPREFVDRETIRFRSIDRSAS